MTKIAIESVFIREFYGKVLPKECKWLITDCKAVIKKRERLINHCKCVIIYCKQVIMTRKVLINYCKLVIKNCKSLIKDWKRYISAFYCRFSL